MPKWGFNYSKIAKTWFLIDPNTFFDDSGTSKISKKIGPVVGPISSYLPWIYFKKYKEKYWNILRKYGFLISENLEISIFWESLVYLTLGFWNFEIWRFEDLKFGNLKIWNFEIWRFEISKFEDLKFWRSEISIIILW